MHKQHVTDLLSDKISSNILTLIDNSGHTNSLLWDCLINQNSDKRPCLVVQSGTHYYPTSLQNKKSISFLGSHQYDNHLDLLEAIRKSTSKLKSENPSPSSFVFIESLTWFLLDYSIDWEFEYWTRQLLASLFELACHPAIHRLVLCFEPIRDQSGHLGTCSDQIVKSLDSISTSLVDCGSQTKCLGNRIVQNIKVWHRRTVQGEWSKHHDNLFMFNKPAFTETGQIELDSVNLALINFSFTSNQAKPVSTDYITPQSTFDLSLSESEKEARSRVVLPYEISHHTGPNDSSPTRVGECLIHYTPDCFDDLDDEDPDDDLDV